MKQECEKGSHVRTRYEMLRYTALTRTNSKGDGWMGV